MSDDHLIEHTVQQQELLRGHFLHVVRDSVRLPNQRLATREYVVHPGAVMVIPMLETSEGLRLVMERQFRYPVGQVMVEFPAGKLDAGEDPFVCAQRELLEETGYSAAQWARAGVLHPVIAYSTEVIEIWFAKDLSLGERQLDQDEFLDVFTATPDELMSACQQGLVTDGKTLTGLLWLQNVLSGQWSLHWQTAT
ncbi:NUDIX domain-containing protein [Limnohabitans sp. WS1]|uniref:NUDIX domain-containing protein n=1 Tax=Limnohabitans sp. WS1 TaxID=1100726 RepID=UPI000D3C51B4|nr:NUDIX hydrolase [Limnohabitans sp. WS1]PUE07340.1 ADP-ribose pyrophosphatase [Limnohabitans sp. WS1]